MTLLQSGPPSTIVFGQTSTVISEVSVLSAKATLPSTPLPASSEKFRFSLMGVLARSTVVASRGSRVEPDAA